MGQGALRAVEVLLSDQRVNVAVDSEHENLQIELYKPINATIGAGGSTRSLPAALCRISAYAKKT
ncbi:hypothetical protein BOC40_01850 [Burkholderia pseudomallei]|nr:hypothetical protein BOC35_23740 [Burkholderia pseudomallei]EDO89733.1 hypothetical protein BURPSPAST_Y0069 [Burkholderia pseudomallei Pasteur 52237]PNW99553.1 hypothetical protein CF649_24575 [Burkholderia sp. 136(2017)]PNX12500.1 hypothetical protein CF650_25195 [Burkholderia sp. 129]PNX26849.1 hypothetical protein CF647_24170 [Burkholderia sp. 117]PNX35575.1 hypothetical protein CF648_24580 [Burkholderia sp. 137]